MLQLQFRFYWYGLVCCDVGFKETTPTLKPPHQHHPLIPMPIKEESIWKFLKEKLDIHSKNVLYIEAFTHDVDLNKNPTGKTNQRLAFLGDSVLNHTIAARVFKDNPGWVKGQLTTKSNKLRSNSNFADIFTNKLKLPDEIIIGDNKPVSEKGKFAMRAKALEALFGAIYLDQGLEKARMLAEKHLF